MNDGGTHDLGQYFTDARAKILASGKSREQLLDETREVLRELRLALPTYKQLMDEARSTMIAEDIDEYESTYMQLANDRAGIFEHDDYVELLANVQTTMRVMSIVFERAATAGPASAAKSPLATRRVGGCTSTIVLLIVLAVVGWIATMALR